MGDRWCRSCSSCSIWMCSARAERRQASVEEDAALDGLATDGALAHAVPTQLTSAVATHEDHVFEPVQTYGTHGLLLDVLELLLELLNIRIDICIVFVSL